MIGKTAIKVLMFLMIFFTSNIAHSYCSKDTLEAIFHHAQSAVCYVESDKVYLHHNRVYFDEGRIFLDGESNIAIQLPYICSNETGLYLQSDMTHQMITIWICANPHCQRKYYYEPSRCLTCGNSFFNVRYEIPRR